MNKEAKEDLEIMEAALICGFVISTAYGQGKDKLMPISDYATLKAFADRVREIPTDAETIAMVANIISLVPITISSTRRNGQNGIREINDLAKAAIEALNKRLGE